MKETACVLRPIELVRITGAPSCFDKKRLWFEKTPFAGLERSCLMALVVSGLEGSRFPTNVQDASFVFGGALVADLLGELIVPPRPLSFCREEMPHVLWSFVWEAVETHRNALEGRFLALMLGAFLPRQTQAAPERPCYYTRFGELWEGLEYSSPVMDRVSTYLGDKNKEEGRRALKRLPNEMQTAITNVSEHVPAMLEITLAHL